MVDPHMPGAVPLGTARPAHIESTVSVIVRNPHVKAWVLAAAHGACEGCDAPAPFQDTDGFPFLEVHHVLPLARGGSDRVSNAVALCPNCHRRCHFSTDRGAFTSTLYEKISRLCVEQPPMLDTALSVFAAADNEASSGR
jgi:5-methylcytosine-specific restriction enzyme A